MYFKVLWSIIATHIVQVVLAKLLLLLIYLLDPAYLLPGRKLTTLAREADPY